tara:strand:+ start:204 stop:434 length:231 start_codon:yes stop_codon:yes gene_type:complete
MLLTVRGIGENFTADTISVMAFCISDSSLMKWPMGWLSYLGFIFGAASFPIYALTVSHTNDYVDSTERVVVRAPYC